MKKLTLFFFLLLVVSAACKQHRQKYKDEETSSSAQDTAQSSDMSNPNDEEQQKRNDLRAVSLLPDKPYVIKGKVKGGAGYLIILERVEFSKLEPIVSATLNGEGEFKIPGTIKQADLYQLRINGDDKKAIQFPLFPGDDLYFTFDINHVENFQVNGSSEPVLLYQMFDLLWETNNKIQDMEDLQNNTTDKAKVSRMVDTLPHFNDRIQKEKSANLRKFAAKIDTTFTAMMATERLDAEYPDNFDFMERMDKICEKRFPHNQFYRDIHNKVITYAPVSRGHIMPDILVTDAKGASIRPSNLKGKYVLVYFWNVECKDCKDEIPRLKKLYAKYKPKGFEILGISIDNDRAEWMETVNSNNLPGFQANDIGLFKSAAAQTLLVSTTPYTFILNKEGRIIEKRQNMDEVERQLVKVFGF